MAKSIDPRRVRETLTYEPDTGLFFWLPRSGSSPEIRRWNRRYSGAQTFHFTGTKGYLIGKIDAVTLKAHRVAWAYVYGDWPDGMIDHINGDTSDNRIANLRISDPLGNASNQRAYSKRSDLPPGVNRNGKKFGARVQVRGISHYIGSFETPEQAHEAYVRAARVFGFSERHGSLKGDRNA